MEPDALNFTMPALVIDDTETKKCKARTRRAGRGERNETKCSVASVKLDVISDDLCDFNNKLDCARKNVINAQFVMLQPFEKRSKPRPDR